MSIETRTIRVAEADLAERLNEVLDRVAKGERIIVEREGEIFAAIVPAQASVVAPSNDAEHSATQGLVFDDEFVRNMAEFRNAINSARFGEWPE